jgi:ribosome-associated protein
MENRVSASNPRSKAAPSKAGTAKAGASAGIAKKISAQKITTPKITAPKITAPKITAKKTAAAKSAPSPDPASKKTSAPVSGARTSGAKTAKLKSKLPAKAAAKRAAKTAQIAPPGAKTAKVAQRKGLPTRQSKPVDRLKTTILKAIEELKAKDVVVIDVRGRTSVTDELIIATGTSTRHVKSIADNVVSKAKAIGIPPIGVEGESGAEWVLVDLGDYVVHLMQAHVREFYALEKLWSTPIVNPDEAAN